jgi:hypothetical protein
MTHATHPAAPSRSLLKPLLLVTGLGVMLALQACAVVAVADAAVTVVATGVKVTTKAVGAVADAVIPDGK